MKWKDKEVKDMSDDELSSANSDIDKMWSDNETKRADPAFVGKMNNQEMPHVNPSFVGLMKEIKDETVARAAKKPVPTSKKKAST